MLQIKEIRKTYVTGELVQTALDGVSLNLRDNEFVAILGPSGSGKTTLLNVIGGLDRYDSGDLIINCISTRKYSDRDWDSYRNHTIGFVFQSYNLIPHQSVLANVELALTISGISRSERRKRATSALEAVGLGNQLHKRPNQMSGGQMQRVAIARALVNDPDILLADEPTGALDSETSVQVMELLKEVSRDRLVVMVTHNPELAEEYANRIVRVKDGRIIGDTNPYTVDDSQLAAAEYKNMGKSTMSFLTALSLSFNNLLTKKARTLLTAFAGSIGIIGIALIMSLSTGFQMYIDKIQADTLSNYPLTIQTETSDMSSAFAAFGASMQAANQAEDGTVVEQQMISQMFAQVGTNDLGSLKRYLENYYDKIGHTINTIQYSYGITPRIYCDDMRLGVIQANPSTLFNQIMGNSMMASYMNSNIFYQMMDNMALLDSQYRVMQGKWPESYNELVVVLSNPSQISDFMSYTLGLRDPKELEELMARVMAGEVVDSVSDFASWTYDDLMNLRFRLVNVPDLYRYNAEYGVWEDMSGDEAFMRDAIASGEELRIVGIVCPREDVNATALTAGVAYTSALTEHVIEAASDAQIVESQRQNPNINVFTGAPFREKSESQLNFQNMISVDAEAISSAFGMNISAEEIRNLLGEFMNNAMNSLKIDTGPAKKAFLDTFSYLATDMLQKYVEIHADDSGTATLYLQDVGTIAGDYLDTEYAKKVISGVAGVYGLPDDVFTRVYGPLLSGLLTDHIARNLPLADLDLPGATEPEESEPTQPDTTDPTEIPEQPEDVPEIPTEIATEPVEDIPDGTQGESEPTTEPVTEETAPEMTEETLPAAAEPVATEPAAPASSASPAEDPPVAVPTEPPVAVPTEPPVTVPTEPPQIQPIVDADMLSAPITSAEIDGVVAQYLSNPLVVGTASVISGQMVRPAMQQALANKLREFGNVLSGYIGHAFHVDGDKIASAFQFNMSEEDLQRLMMAMSGRTQEQSAKANLQTLGYADLNVPTSMSIYLRDFEAKEEFMAFLDGYNADMEEIGQDDRVIRYTDVTGIMMSSVRTIIDSVSYALIAFVAVSLVVSSIMIGIITYISVMERTKEIGVLRAIGASKRNISQVFNAETFIIGLCSGLIGIGVTLALLVPGNMLILHLTDNPDIVAQLPVANALVLILLSMVLTLIGGFIPAKQAAKKDPVIALRSE